MKTTAFDEQTVTIKSAGNVLQGTWTQPCSNNKTDQHLQAVIAVLLLIPDSGPMDRNQNSVQVQLNIFNDMANYCLLYTSPSPRDRTRSRMPSSA